ncbi:DNA repair RAD52-like protein 2, chloroplastic [Prosopis cineraria]|uniref:DNA repair RAD52-like protein 2, chloroplastic n=1 Tax=Prosopis cineraria TaxID=364024 RepID=UPI00240FE04B|nr:DNA repair RAD52-like protein 2, chloroplastic [Prosopis cineraria]
MASSIRPSPIPFTGIGIRSCACPSLSCGNQIQSKFPAVGSEIVLVTAARQRNLRRTGFPGSLSLVSALERSNSGSNSSDGKKGGVSNSNYVVPLDKSFPFSNSSITRPLAEILRDLNKRIPDNIVKPHVDGDPSAATLIPWYHANRMLSFYAPGWCGEIRDVIFSDNGSVTVVYRVTVRGSDGEAHRESTGTVSPTDGHIGDPVAAAEEIAFCKACARFGLGLYLYHED